MADAKPPGMSWESFIEHQIQQGREAGAFDALPGAGKPLPGLDGPYEADWWLRRFLRREEIAPPCAALDVRREVEAALARIRRLNRAPAVRDAVAALNATIARANATTITGPSTTQATLDPDEVVREWRRRRGAAPS